MSLEKHTLRVECPPCAAHAGTIPIRVLKAARRDGGPWRAHLTTDQTLVGDELQGDAWRLQTRGSRTTPPARMDLIDDERLRWSLECPKCGVKVDMRKETAAQLVEKLAEAGVSRLSLPALAATL